MPIGLSEPLLFFSNASVAAPFNTVKIDMRSGIFTILNGLTNKINRYTSYGDLVFSLYDQERNGTPTTPLFTAATQPIVSRHSSTYPFNAISNVAVSAQGVFYVADHVAEAQAVYDEDLESALRMRVIRYDSKNDSPVVIGQEGLGGTPFPHIHSLHVVSEDNLVVVCDIGDTWLVFWYSAAGRLLYEVAFPPVALPALITDSDAIGIESITPDRQARRLYVQVNYYTHQSNATSRLYWINLPDGIYQEYIEIPSSPVGEDGQWNPPFNFLGITEQSHLVFYSFVGDGALEVLVMNLDSSVLLRRTVALTAEPILFSDFSLSIEGVITAFIAHEQQTSVFWWRLDRELARLTL